MAEIAKQLKTITAGRMVTACLYTIPKYRLSDSRYTRRERARCSSAGRTAINNRNSALMFERLVFANFGAEDYYCTFEYAPDHLPHTRREVLRDWRRFRRRLKDSGWPDLRYIYVPEHRHGAGRWHTHAVLGGTGGRLDVAAWAIEEAWGKGGVHIRPIRGSFSEIGELARYLTKERPEVGDRGYIPSRGLRRPEVDSRRVPDSTRLEVPDGAYVMDRQEVRNEYGEFTYLKYYLPDPAAPAPEHYPKI